jgi:hypothetical protein
MIKSTSFEEKETKNTKPIDSSIRKALSMEMGIEFTDENSNCLRRGKEVNESKITLD